MLQEYPWRFAYQEEGTVGGTETPFSTLAGSISQFEVGGWDVFAEEIPNSVWPWAVVEFWTESVEVLTKPNTWSKHTHGDRRGGSQGPQASRSFCRRCPSNLPSSVSICSSVSWGSLPSTTVYIRGDALFKATTWPPPPTSADPSVWTGWIHNLPQPDFFKPR